MEGWDGTEDGRPGPLTVRRWRHFGASGAKLIWGGEAVAVVPEGRANPHQLYVGDHTLEGLGELRRVVVDTHCERFGTTDDLLVGLQLTHSGRFARPNRGGAPEPRVAFRHPVLDPRVGVDDDSYVLTDGEVAGIIERFVAAAVRAAELGYDFVDIKHCHGYLLHEFLGAHTRPGPYGGSFENRTRILREIVAGIRRDAAGLGIGVRVSAFDTMPYHAAGAGDDERAQGVGAPDLVAGALPYRYGFGTDESDPAAFGLDEARSFLALLRGLDIRLVNVSGGSPYYNPHLQRPALYPPSDGYLPPEDPLAGVVRHLRVVRELERDFPDLVLIVSAVSYLQDYLPHVSQAIVRDGWVDMVGIGRMVLSYWELPADCLEHGELRGKKRICRTFSDCTTAPRSGLVSGCYPLDSHYRELEEAAQLREIKRSRRS